MLPPHATSEFGTLRHVAMRYAAPFTRHLYGPDIHPVLARQMTTSTWASYDVNRVRTQQDAVIDLLRARDIDISLLAPADGCSAQHYPRDLGFVIDDVLFLARLNSRERRPEAEALIALTAGMANVARLAGGTIEGGDVMLHAGCVLVGLSEETSKQGVAALRTALSQAEIDRDVIPVEFTTHGIVHLDDHFNIAAPGIALVHRSVFSAVQLRWFERHFDVIDVTDAEALKVQANILALAPGTVIVTDGSDRIAAELSNRGIEVLTVDYSEVTKIPGSLRCSTLPLHRS
ncbi:arginine deiminase family protein [Streptomyces sp. NPDC052101]|uniref:dimethylarginine dimethylaminohydrolase family protein n=1 Tax=Streptomyces sp. NPDC052101 TaxID=3155763 RepID=UPI0034458942